MQSHYMFHPASLHPPCTPDSSSRRRTDWVLLDDVAYIADRPNATTVRGHTPAGQPVEVTFYLADPPGLSHFCVHCPGLDKAELEGEPVILCCEKDVAILQIHFSTSAGGGGPGVRSARHRRNVFFVFKADREHPSLRALPDPYPLFFRSHEVAMFLSGADGEGFHIAALRPPQLDKGDYELHTFSSKTWAWTTRAARLPPSKATGARIPIHAVQKTIVLEGDLVGFVDLSKGIIFCRVLDESPCPLLLHHVRLPPPMHINRGLLNCAPAIRDVTCIDGVIRFVEIACRTRRVLLKRKRSDDDYNNDPRHHARVLYDSDLEDLEDKRSSSCVVVDAPEFVYVPDGWSVVTWNRLVGSDHWAKDREVDVNDVTVDDPRHLSLLPELRGGHSGSGESSPLMMNKSLVTFAPTFGMRDADVVYLMCKVEGTDETAWVLAINTRKKSLQDLASFSPRRACAFYRIYCPYAISI